VGLRPNVPARDNLPKVKVAEVAESSEESIPAAPALGYCLWVQLGPAEALDLVFGGRGEHDYHTRGQESTGTGRASGWPGLSLRNAGKLAETSMHKGSAYAGVSETQPGFEDTTPATLPENSVWTGH
jgi:hypothetical protein